MTLFINWIKKQMDLVLGIGLYVGLELGFGLVIGFRIMVYFTFRVFVMVSTTIYFNES